MISMKQQNSLAAEETNGNELQQHEKLKYQIISVILVVVILVASVIFFYSFWRCLVFGHRWQDVSCETPQTCSVCSKTLASALGHNWIPATCTTPQTCSVCQEAIGDILGHRWIEATNTSPKTCVLCGLTEGSALIVEETSAPTEATEATTEPTSARAYIEEKIRNANLVHIPESFYDEPIAYTCISKEGVLMSGYGTIYEKVGGALYGETLYVYAEMSTSHGMWYFVENERGAVGWAGFKMSKQNN